MVKGYWAGQHKGADFEAWWRSAVHDGMVPDTALPDEDARASDGARHAASRSKQRLAANSK